jgi:hypothetical protein
VDTKEVSGLRIEKSEPALQLPIVGYGDAREIRNRQERPAAGHPDGRPPSSKIHGRPITDHRHIEAATPATTVNIGGVVLTLPAGMADVRVRSEIEKTGTYCDEGLLKLIKDGTRNAVVVDIDAGIGNYSIYLAKVGGAATVLAYEYDQSLADAFEENIAANGLGEKIKLRRINLGGVPGFPGFHPAHPADGAEKPQTLDEQDLDVDHVDVVRFGRRSFNPRAVDGAIATLEKHRPTYIMAESPNRSRFNSSMVDKLKALGYEEVNKNGPVVVYKKV